MNKNSFALGILIALFGLFMIISPASVVVLAAIILGIGAIADGCFILIAFQHLIADSKFRVITLVRGCLSILIGLLAIILPLAFAKVMWAAMVYMLAAYLVVSSVLEIIAIVQLKKNSIETKSFIIEVICSLIVAAVLFIIPASSLGAIIIRICGAVVLLSGAGYAFYTWKHRDLIIEAESVDDDSADAKTAEAKTESDTEQK